LRIVLERRGTMYDPLVVDTFVRSYRRIMPSAESSVHPAAQAIDEARKNAVVPAAAAAIRTAVPAADEVLAFTSLSRAICGDASINDVGALLWMMVRQVLPCQAMALCVRDERTDLMTAAYAAGAHAAPLWTLRVPMAQGVIGWTAVNRRTVANAAAATDTGGEHSPLRWTMTVPLVHDGALRAVLSLYSETMPFSEDQARLVELVAPSAGAAVAALHPGRRGPVDRLLLLFDEHVRELDGAAVVP
jgi:GAF domain-containing protein